MVVANDSFIQKSRSDLRNKNASISVADVILAIDRIDEAILHILELLSDVTNISLGDTDGKNK
jgi:hypothetical protein